MSNDKNPEINKDSQRSKIDPVEPSTWSSPLDDAANGFRFGQSDLHAKRVTRLKDYLSDTSKGSSENLDVTSTLGQSDYPIDNGADENPNSFEKDVVNQRTSGSVQFDYNEAFRMFHSLSHGSTFSDDQNADLQPGKHSPGTHSESLGKTRTAVQSLISNNTGRWGSLNNDNFTFDVVNPDDTEVSHKRTEADWQDYFAAKKKEAQDMKDKFVVDGKGLTIQNPFGYNIDRDPTLTQRENGSIPTDSVFNDDTNDIFEFAHHAYSTLTYGMAHDEKNRFVNSDIIPTDALQFALDLLELYLLGVAIGNVGNLFQAAAAYGAQLQGRSDEIEDSKDKSLEPWDNIYHDHPRFKNPKTLRKGTSGWNGNSIDHMHFGESSHDTAYNKLFKSPPNEFKPGDNLVDLFNNVKMDVETEVSHVANIFSELLRDINVHIPRYTLQNMRANNDSFIGSTGKDILLAYNISALNGILHLAVHSVIHGALDFRDRGFFRNLSRNLLKSRSYMKNFVHHDFEKAAGEQIKHFLGEGQKIIAFFNYCVQIGDLSVVQTPSSHASVSENKVPLDMMEDHPSLRVAKYRRHATNESTFSMRTLPSLYLYPNENLMGGMAAMNGGDRVGFNYMGSARPLDEDGYSEDTLGGSQFVKANNTNRFSPETVKVIEDALEAEQMPFYIQDLRTNEIISFHAFLTDLSDSYSASWNAAQGFGRMEAAQIYGGGTRNIGVSFTMVSFNEEDFNEMWWKINKLTTMVYPQWSRGTKLDYKDGELDGTIIQPFSQVPTASPLCRLRVGDVFTSNYSEQNIARLFGVGSETSMKYASTQGETDYYLNNSGTKVLDQYHRDRNLEIKYSKYPYIKVTREDQPNDLVTLVYNGYPILRNISKEKFDSLTYFLVNPDENQDNIDISGFFNPDNNPIIRSFNSNKGRGIAVAVTGLTFAWKYGETPWNAEPGSRAPRQCDVSMTIIPIHDITPGLDHNGINRAPIYGVGEYSNNMKGDPHYTTPDYNKKMQEISRETEARLRGKGDH